MMEELRIHVAGGLRDTEETFFVCGRHRPTALRNIRENDNMELMERTVVSEEGRICAICYEQNPLGWGSEPLKMGSTKFRYP
jgi:hypothetical protein